MTEAELHNAIEEMKLGNEAAFGQVYDAYSGALYGLCLKVLNDSEAAQDVLQESWIKIWKNIKSYDSTKGRFFTWTLNIARNTAIDHYRKRSKKSAVSIQNEESIVSIKDHAHNGIRTNHIGIRDLIKGLPEEQQQIVEFLYFRGYTQQEVSDELNIPLGTVKTRSRTALKSLKEIFTILISWM